MRAPWSRRELADRRLPENAQRRLDTDERIALRAVVAEGQAALERLDPRTERLLVRTRLLRKRAS